MAKGRGRATRQGGAVIIRRTNGRVGPQGNARLGKAVGVASIGSPSSANGKHPSPAKTTVVSKNER
jgi:hypothetical protein